MKWKCLTAITLLFLLGNESLFASGKDGKVPPLDEEDSSRALLRRPPEELEVDRTGEAVQRNRVRIRELRRLLSERDLDGYIIPHSDEYQTEELSEHSQRLKWLTGFTGSYGTAIIMREQGVLLVDSRYELQAKTQIPLTDITVADNSPEGWLSTLTLSSPLKVGFDPRLYVDQEMRALERKLGRLVVFVETPDNLVDQLWVDKPLPPANTIQIYPEKFAGESSIAKITKVKAKLAKDDVDVAVISDPDAISWLLNIRGTHSLANTPVVLGTLIFHRSGPLDFFVDSQHTTPETMSSLQESGVTIHGTQELQQALHSLGERQVLVDEKLVSRWIVRNISSRERLIFGEDPCWQFMVRKNHTEVAQIRLAHVCDGLALCEFLAWVDKVGGIEPNLTERSLADKLWEIRQRASRTFKRFHGEDFLVSLSFPTISAFGPNAAMVHYPVDEVVDGGARISSNSLYLVDSGAQYRNGGTTDITRTVVIGTPTQEQRDNFTRVLKGHIALANVQFLRRTPGRKLDILARQYLWGAGLHYGHGTGHGVGSFLSVHESPKSNFSDRMSVSLHEGMVVSNEPGYYKEGEYGIRTENLMLVVPSSHSGFSRFETISLVPIDRRLINYEMLAPEEVTWLDNYHRLVFKTLSPHFESHFAWLREQTKPYNQDYEDGFELTKDAHDKSQEVVERGLTLIKKAAEKGDAEAQRRLALYSLFGIKYFPSDLKEAFKWAHKAFEGFVYSRNSGWIDTLAGFYEYGWGTVVDLTKALALSVQAADPLYEGGNAEAQYRLAWMYKHGWGGVERNIEQAEYYLGLASQQTGKNLPESALSHFQTWANEYHSVVAALLLGEYYEMGYATLGSGKPGNLEDLKEALRYYEQAQSLSENTVTSQRIKRVRTLLQEM